MKILTYFYWLLLIPFLLLFFSPLLLTRFCFIPCNHKRTSCEPKHPPPRSRFQRMHDHALCANQNKRRSRSVCVWQQLLQLLETSLFASKWGLTCRGRTALHGSDKAPSLSVPPEPNRHMKAGTFSSTGRFDFMTIPAATWRYLFRGNPSYGTNKTFSKRNTQIKLIAHGRRVWYEKGSSVYMHMITTRLASCRSCGSLAGWQQLDDLSITCLFNRLFVAFLPPQGRRYCQTVLCKPANCAAKSLCIMKLLLEHAYSSYPLLIHAEEPISGWQFSGCTRPGN